MYLIIYLDCIHVKEWVGKNEGSKFWMQVVTELKNRVVEQIYVVCVDG